MYGPPPSDSEDEDGLSFGDEFDEVFSCKYFWQHAIYSILLIDYSLPLFLYIT